jgi:hypothetical protein
LVALSLLRKPSKDAPSIGFVGGLGAGEQKIAQLQAILLWAYEFADGFTARVDPR